MRFSLSGLGFLSLYLLTIPGADIPHVRLANGVYAPSQVLHLQRPQSETDALFGCTSRVQRAAPQWVVAVTWRYRHRPASLTMQRSGGSTESIVSCT
ncbi:hypothetical protein BJY52DRAFT_1265462 [Lactarius psammicola]|nr:hypothetical protein BJY52DRAFT_1265462 [Lactarius psammicola]